MNQNEQLKYKGIYYAHTIGIWICFYNSIIWKTQNAGFVFVKGLNNILFHRYKCARDYTNIRLCVNCQHDYRTNNMMIY